MKGLSFPIQDEISMHCTLTIEDAYQMALKAKEKLKRINIGSNKGGTPSSNWGHGGLKENLRSLTNKRIRLGMHKVPPKGEEDIQEVEVVGEEGPRMSQESHSSFIDATRKAIRHQSALNMMIMKGSQLGSL